MFSEAASADRMPGRGGSRAGPGMSLDRPGAARRLLRRAAAPDPDGLVVGVDPASAGWDYTTCHVYRLRPGQAVNRAADDQERLVLVLEGRAAVRAGDHDFGVVGSRTTVFDGPPCPVILLEPGLPVEIVAESDALVVVAGAPGGTVRRTALVPPEDILVETRGSGQTERRDPPPAAAVGRGRPPDRVRGVHARRQLVQLPAPQARHGEPARRGPPRGALLLPLRQAPGLRLRPRLHRGPVARRGDDPDRLRHRGRARGLPPGRCAPTATTATTST